jgi:hypothetical protein
MDHGSWGAGVEPLETLEGSAAVKGEDIQIT